MWDLKSNRGEINYESRISRYLAQLSDLLFDLLNESMFFILTLRLAFELTRGLLWNILYVIQINRLPKSQHAIFICSFITFNNNLKCQYWSPSASIFSTTWKELTSQDYRNPVVTKQGYYLSSHEHIVNA